MRVGLRCVCCVPPLFSPLCRTVKAAPYMRTRLWLAGTAINHGRRVGQSAVASLPSPQFRRWLLAAVSQILDYGGSVVNYAVIGAAVFLAPRAAGDGGDVARLVSTASFATLMLIDSLTQARP